MSPRICCLRHTTGDEGQAYGVHLPPDCAASKRCGARFVWHVVAPNVNPRKRDSHQSMDEAEPLLRACYDNLFANFWRALQS